jgi:hypothetical protein
LISYSWKAACRSANKTAMAAGLLAAGGDVEEEFRWSDGGLEWVDDEGWVEEEFMVVVRSQY